MEPLKRFKFVAGTHYGTPKEVWGFRTKLGRGEPSFQARDSSKPTKTCWDCGKFLFAGEE